MQLKIDIKPIKITGRTRADVVGEIQRRWNASWICGSKRKSNGLGVDSYSAYRKSAKFGDNDTDFVLYNLVKFRNKSKDTDKGRVRVRDAHWDAYVYIVPSRLVRSATQGTRNFKLVVG